MPPAAAGGKCKRSLICLVIILCSAGFLGFFDLLGILRNAGWQHGASPLPTNAYQRVVLRPATDGEGDVRPVGQRQGVPLAGERARGAAAPVGNRTGELSAGEEVRNAPSAATRQPFERSRDWLANVRLCGAPIAITTENIRTNIGRCQYFLGKLFQKFPLALGERVLKMDNLLPPPWGDGTEERGHPLADTCALVSSGGRLLGSKQGKHIDNHTLVIRVNLGGTVLPTLIPEDAGKRTNIILMGHRDTFPFLESEGKGVPKMVPQMCEKLVPTLMSGGPPEVRAPKETNAPQFGLLQVQGAASLTSYLDCREHLVKIGRVDDARKMQLIHPAIWYSKAVLELQRPSSGFVGFRVAMSLCKSITPYGFGVVEGLPYHAYKWCDVDRLLGIATMDCAKIGGREGRTSYGFKDKVTFHPFTMERKAMSNKSYSQPSELCRKKCNCTGQPRQSPGT